MYSRSVSSLYYYLAGYPAKSVSGATLPYNPDADILKSPSGSESHSAIHNPDLHHWRRVYPSSSKLVIN